MQTQLALWQGWRAAHLPAALLGHRCSASFSALGSRACCHGVLPAHRYIHSQVPSQYITQCTCADEGPGWQCSIH